VKWAVAPGVKQRRGDHRRLAARSGIREKKRRRRVERARLVARGALRRPGRARGQDHDAAAVARRRRFSREPAAISSSIVVKPEGRRCPARRSRRAPDGGGGAQLDELLVVDQTRGPRSQTSAICGPANEVFSSSTVAPSFDAATVDLTKPAWSRQRIAIPSPSRRRASRRLRASALVCACSSRS
jgi:hypothetical protein